MRRRSSLLLSCSLALALPNAVRAGSLQDIEDSAKHHEERPSHQQDDDDDDGARAVDDAGSSGPGTSAPANPLWAYILLAPWSLPRAFVDERCYTRFAQYPYADEPAHARLDPACLAESPGAVAVDPAAPAGRALAAQVALEGAYALSHLAAGTVAARLQLPYRLELDGRLSFWQDLQPRAAEQALSGTLHLGLRFAQSKHVAFRTALGMRAFGLHEALIGFDALYGIEVFGQLPLIAHIELHGGTLGEALTAQARCTLGVQLWKLELYAGYDHTVFSGHGRVTRLGGPVLGLRAWF